MATVWVTKPLEENYVSQKKSYGRERQATIQDLLQERMRLAIRHTLVTVLEEEVNEFIQAALYQRAPERRDQRNGNCEYDMVTTMGEIEEPKVSRTRNGFSGAVVERYQQRRAELDECICEMFVKHKDCTCYDFRDEFVDRFLIQYLHKRRKPTSNPKGYCSRFSTRTSRKLHP